MKTRLVILLTIICMISCSDDQNSTCRVVQIIESQDYQNGGEKFQYDFTYQGELLSQMKKSFIKGDPQYYFYLIDYFYNDQNQLVHAERPNVDNLLTNYDFKYQNNLLTEYTAETVLSSSTSSQAREERIISYNALQKINRVDFSFFKNGELFDEYYITVEETTRTDFHYLVSYFTTQNEFTGSIEINTVSTPPNFEYRFHLMERYYSTPFYLFDSIPTRLVYKDKDGVVGTIISYDYKIDNGIMNQFTLDQGIRADLFELKYECE
jgi:hypothetical protein